MRFSPVGEGVNAGVDTGGDQVGDAGPAVLQSDE